jgi:methylated-DNA-[protein]-cysteine S-methyltransferase
MRCRVVDGFAFFDTEIGRCALAWNERGLVGVQLPERRVLATRARVLRRFPAREGTPPPDVQRAIDAMAALLRGEAVDLSTITLDLGGVPPFHQRVYEVARKIPPGRTMTYGEIAIRLGDADAARAVGQAMAQNPFPIVVPCHRVVAADGKLGGFSADGGVDTKRRMLAIEGAAAAGAPTLFDAVDRSG